MCILARCFFPVVECVTDTKEKKRPFPLMRNQLIGNCRMVSLYYSPHCLHQIFNLPHEQNPHHLFLFINIRSLETNGNLTVSEHFQPRENFHFNWKTKNRLRDISEFIAKRLFVTDRNQLELVMVCWIIDHQFNQFAFVHGRVTITYGIGVLILAELQACSYSLRAHSYSYH